MDFRGRASGEKEFYYWGRSNRPKRRSSDIWAAQLSSIGLLQNHNTNEVQLDFRELISLPESVNIVNSVRDVGTFRGMEPCMSWR